MAGDVEEVLAVAQVVEMVVEVKEEGAVVMVEEGYKRLLKSTSVQRPLGTEHRPRWLTKLRCRKRSLTSANQGSSYFNHMRCYKDTILSHFQ